MDINSYTFVVICEKEFQIKYYQCLLKPFLHQAFYYLDHHEALDHLQDFIADLDLIIIDFETYSKDIEQFVHLLNLEKEFTFKRYPILFSCSSQLKDSLKEYIDLGAEFVSKPLNQEKMFQAVTSFLSPDTPKLIKNNMFPPLLKRPVLNVERVCPVCSAQIELPVLDSKHIYQSFSPFFLNLFETREGFTPLHWGDEMMVCPNCLFVSSHRHDFISEVVDDFHHSIYHEREKALDRLLHLKDDRLELFNEFYQNLDYFQKKKIGIIGKGGSLFFQFPDHVYLFKIIFQPPMDIYLRTFVYSLSIKTLNSIQDLIFSDDKKKLLYLDLGNQCLKMGSLWKKLKDPEKQNNAFEDSEKYFSEFLNIGNSYYVLFRLARLIYVNRSGGESARYEALNYLSKIFTGARQSYQGRHAKKEEKVPRALLEAAQDLYQEIKDKGI